VLTGHNSLDTIDYVHGGKYRRITTGGQVGARRAVP
jgi:hypothetical protein